jgi:hypothetical protein
VTGCGASRFFRCAIRRAVRTILFDHDDGFAKKALFTIPSFFYYAWLPVLRLPPVDSEQLTQRMSWQTI